MQFDQPAPERLVLQPAPADFLCLPAVIPAAGYLQYPACLFHRAPLTLECLDAAVSLLYGFDRMPTDFFKTSMTSSFSPSCLRRLRISASSSRIRFWSRFCLLTCPSERRRLSASCATALFCHQPHGSGFERIVVPWGCCSFFRFLLFHSMLLFFPVYDSFFCLSIRVWGQGR